MSKCKTCKQQNITLNDMNNYTIEELEKAYIEGNKPSYTKEEIMWFYNLYNRVFGTNKQPGCGKCFVNIRRSLSTRYNKEKYE